MKEGKTELEEEKFHCKMNFGKMIIRKKPLFLYPFKHYAFICF